MILAYFYLRHGRGRVEFVPLFRVVPPPWDSSAPNRRSRWLVGHAPPHAAAATDGTPGKSPVDEEASMGQAMIRTTGEATQELEAGLSLVALEDGALIARTDWLRSPCGTEQRQFRVRRDDAGVECEIRILRDGCRPGAWQYVGRNHGNLDDAIRKACDLQQVVAAFISLYEVVRERSGDS